MVKKSYVPTEAEEQFIVVDFCRLYRIRIVHIPNEGKRTAWTGRQLGQLGLSKGFPDLFIPTANKGYHGMLIELKRTKGSKTTEEQLEWITYLNNSGYYAVICKGADSAIHEIKKYFSY